MKNVLTFVVLSLILSTCRRANSETSGTQNVYRQSKHFPTYDKQGRRIYYNSDEYARDIAKSGENIVFVDTACIHAKKLALQDIDNNKLIYYHDWAPHEKELKDELAKDGIDCQWHSRGCLRTGNFEPYCYQNEMMEELNRRYGHEFFDSIWNAALIKYVDANPDVVFEENGKKILMKNAYKTLMK